MKNDKKISTPVLRRLPKYYRHLEDLSRNGIEKISSKDLSKLINVTASQIRQDLNCFGGFGQQGYGYNVKTLRDNLAEILGVTKRFTAVIVGVGHLGQALANHTTLTRSGVDLVALFDVSSDVVGTEVAGITVKNIAESHRFCLENRVDIAILTLPKSEALSVATVLANAGVKGFWNFTNAEISIPGKEVSVENVYMGDSLMKLCYDVQEDQ